MREHDDGTMFCRVLKDLKVSDFNVGVASAIASYARLRLHKLLTAIRTAGGEIYYCDTDSVICNINLSDYPDLQEEFQWDGDGSELGSLKNECDEVVEKKLKKLKQKEALAEMIEKEGGNMRFDCGVITGCKQYALKKTIVVDGKSHECTVLKCKGYSQRDRELTYEDFRVLNGGGEIVQDQVQFRCPKSNYVSETDSFTIRSQTVTKHIKKVYTKGTELPGGSVVPLEM